MTQQPDPQAAKPAQRKRSSGASRVVPGPDGISRDEHGRALPTLANVARFLEIHPSWVGVLAFDEFAGRTVMVKASPAHDRVPGAPGPQAWADIDDKLTTVWLQKTIQWRGGGPNVATVADAVEAAARLVRIHPVRDYLDRCADGWDGNARIHQWLALFLGVARSPYADAVGARWLISAVARVYQPGCKADHVLVLEGEQGIGKSTALRTVAGEWFTDELPELHSKDAALQLLGRWIIEAAELDAMTRAQVSTVKAFMSRATDVFRPPYGRRTGTFPRQCVFAGTTNSDAYLRDETGGRRFWPVRCEGTAKVDELAAARDQLWGEAVSRYREGACWWLDSVDLTATAQAEQDARYQADAWEGEMLPYLRTHLEGVALGDVLADVFSVERSLWTQPDQNRVAKCLKRLKWQRRQVRRGKDRVWIYVPPEDWQEGSTP